MNPENFCRVCGLIYEDFFPWGENNVDPTYDFCDCCGIEFGYQDCQLKAILNYRAYWLNTGAKWDDESKKPKNWNLEKQLKNIPEKYL